MMLSEKPWRLMWLSAFVLVPVALIALAIIFRIVRELATRTARHSLVRIDPRHPDP